MSNEQLNHVEINSFMVCIGTEGLEAVIETTHVQEEIIMAKLKGHNTVADKEINSFMSSMRLRIRMNSHRDIKTYNIQAPVDLLSFREMLETNKYMRATVAEKGALIRL